jgi:hypothetical protein
MSTLTITFPESLWEFVTDQVIEQGLTAPEEYIEKLVREEQKNKLWAYYEKKLMKPSKADSQYQWMKNSGKNLMRKSNSGVMPRNKKKLRANNETSP